MNHSNILTAAIAAGGIALAVQNAQAQEVIAIEPQNPPTDFVEWTSARSPNLVRAVIGSTRRVIEVVATTNAPVFLDGGCPPASSYPGWGLDLGKKPTSPGRDSAEVDNTAVERTGENGAFTLRTTAPSRPNQTVVAKFACVKIDGTEEKAREELEARFTAVSGSHGAIAPPITPPPFFFREQESKSKKESEGEFVVGLYAGVADTVPTVGTPSNNLGFAGGIEVDPVNNGQAGHFPVGLTYRLGQVPERVMAEDGRKKRVKGFTHCGFAGAAWNPVLVQNSVRLRLGAAAGVCHAEELVTNRAAKVPGQTGIAGRADAAFEVGGANFGARVGADLVFGSNDSGQFWGPSAGVFGRF